MNNTFNFRRFGLVFRKDLIENGKRYMLLILTMIGLIALVITLHSLNFYSNDRNAINYSFLNSILLMFLSFLFFGFGIWFASTFLSPMNHKLKRLSYLISPSSNLEKYLVRWILTTIGFIVAFFTTMWVADVLRVAICSLVYPEIEMHFLDITKLYSSKDNTNFNEYAFPSDVFIFLVSFYFLLQSVFLLGSTFWGKASFIKTFTAGAALSAAYVLICRWAVLLFYGGLDGYSNVLNSFELEQIFSREQVITLSAIVMYAFTITFWILAFFRLKDSEIIKRL